MSLKALKSPSEKQYKKDVYKSDLIDIKYSYKMIHFIKSFVKDIDLSILTPWGQVEKTKSDLQGNNSIFVSCDLSQVHTKIFKK